MKRAALTIKIPAGAVEGGRVRLRGKGAPGIQGGAAGDLLVTIRIADHPLYTRVQSGRVNEGAGNVCGSGAGNQSSGTCSRWNKR